MSCRRHPVPVVMSRALIAALFAGLLTAAAALATAGKHHPYVWRCRFHRARLVASDKRAEVYEVGESDTEGDFTAQWFDGCAYGSTHGYRLGGAQTIGSSSGVGGSYDYTLAGATVAYAEYFLNGPSVTEEEWHVRVVSLRTGRTIRNLPTGTVPCKRATSTEAFPFGVGPVVSLVLREDGAVAWTVSDELHRCPLPKGTREVHAFDRSGERVLAVGTDVDARSLKLAGNTIYWKQGRQVHSARLN
jgi:hypothetical protein